MNCNINSSGLYDVNAYNLTATNATVLSSLNVDGNIIGSGTALTNLNYDSITNKPSLTLFNNPITCVSSLNVSGNSNLNNLNASGSSYFFGHIFGQQNIYGVSFIPAADPQQPNRSITISTRGTGNLNLNAVGNGALICNVSGTSRMIINNNNVSINSSLNVSGPITLRSSIFCNTNDDKAFTFDNAGFGRLGFIKQSGFGPKICAATGNSIIFSHLSSGDLTQTISSTGVTVLNRVSINSNGNVGIGISSANALLHVSGTTILNNPVSCLSTLNVVGDRNTSGLSVFTMNTNINNLNATSTTIFNNLNSISTFSKLNIDNLNATSTTLLTYINNLTNPSTLTTNNLNVSGTTKLNNSTTLISSLNVSGITTLNNYTIINGNNQLEPKILLSGQEYLIPAQTSTDGVALLLGANRLNTHYCLLLILK